MLLKSILDDDVVNEALEDARVRSAFIGRFRRSEAYRVACSMPQELSHEAQLKWLTAQPQIVEWLHKLIRDANAQESVR
jgi:hypothetical protein